MAYVYAAEIDRPFQIAGGFLKILQIFQILMKSPSAACRLADVAVMLQQNPQHKSLAA
jgi:hypothetical protein